MSNSQVASRQHGLTLVQWSLLVLAFMVGLGSTLVIREAFLPSYISMVQATPVQVHSSGLAANPGTAIR